MIDSSRDNLDKSVRHFLSNEGSDFLRKFEILENEVTVKSDTLNWNVDYTDIVIPHCHSLEDKILLALLSWYVPRNVRFLLILWLDANWGPDFREVKEVILNNKEWALGWLQIQERWNGNDFFGNVLTKNFVRRACTASGFRKVSTKKVRRYTGWSRGHRDGTSSIHPNSSREGPPAEEIARIEEYRENRELDYQLKLLSLLSLVEMQLQFGS